MLRRLIPLAGRRLTAGLSSGDARSLDRCWPDRTGLWPAARAPARGAECRQRSRRLPERGCADARRRPSLLRGRRQQGSALLLHLCRGVGGGWLARTVSSRRALARSRRSLDGVARSRASCPSGGGYRQLPRVPARADRRLVPRRHVDACRSCGRSARALVLASKPVRCRGSRPCRRDAVQAQPGTACGRSDPRACARLAADAEGLARSSAGGLRVGWWSARGSRCPRYPR